MRYLILALVFLTGCVEDQLNFDSSSKGAVIIGVENSRVYGSCAGSQLDAYNIEKLLNSNNISSVKLVDENATYNNVYKAISSVMTNELAIVYYSGHGGSQEFSDTKDEVDGKDEFICLYDRHMKDDTIWELINKSSGKVFLIFDCCHSETMYKLPITLNISKRILKGSSEVNMLCWSGCPDDSYSYGSIEGGKLTNSILKNWNNKYSYNDLWNILSKDSTLSRYQSIKCTKIGNFDTSAKLLE